MATIITTIITIRKKAKRRVAGKVNALGETSRVLLNTIGTGFRGYNLLVVFPICNKE